MTSKEIRQQFLEFFKSKDHQIVESAPMVIKRRSHIDVYQCRDESIKDLFLGNAPVKYHEL